VTVAAGPASILRVAENVNDGWRATLDGEPLEPVVVDGWQQGYRVPAGRGGDVVLEFAPDTWYRGALLAGLALGVLLLALAAVSLRREPREGRGGSPDLTSPGRAVGLGAALMAGIGGLVLGGAPWAVGWAAGLVPPVRRYAVALGAAALVVSGVLVATSPGLAAGRPGVWADLTAAFGLGLLVAQVVRVRRPRFPGRRARRVG
jgi:arabinofuranan 3-O-arabinosyltransferase